MNGILKIAVITTAVLLLVGVAAWASTAPYPGNEGLSRTPGVIIGGTDTPAPSDFSTVNDVGGTLMMKQSGFPPLVIYLSYVGTPDGVITATRPDGGYWARRVTKGDAILIPEGTPHQYTAVEGSITYLEVRFNVPIE